MKYFIKRLIQAVPVLFIISFIIFSLVYMAGDPVLLMLPEDAPQEDKQALREALNLDEPFHVQYMTFVGNLMQGQFGKSFTYGQEALPIVLERLPATIELAFAAIFVATIISIPFGIWSATKKDSLGDVFISGGAVLGKAMPNFWLGIMLILLFSVYLGALPVSGRGTIFHLILPAITLGTGIAAQITRLIRSNMLDILHQEYIRTARSKGLKEFLVIYKHALRNSLIPVVTIMALQTSSLIGGAIITETVFSWPGLGQLLIQAINTRDMAIVQASVFVVALLVIMMNLLADVMYRFLDPRINLK
ncbi:ABC transporter permease [Peribacillus cavernae]|uniref:ABC transporter permease n=1 Tax=Peribacillus cavernae TaxID=1674310 RepID=A0A3S0VGD4_9BACI|nr:ABC transporter permease [Peribacillus cavernae]MDQ0218605.1 peptide/nickel transport system permease protein [Peribacillus cavernae]RUQ31590.1 ABC transporter permease [Peribacillus cavernae]